MAFDLADCNVSLERMTELWKPVADTHRMSWRMHDTRRRRRMAILVGKREHCLRELLWRWEDGQLDCDLPLVISNHKSAEGIVKRRGLPFHV
ncbi:MAG: formyltetrahydrofolate deformylase, partial [Phycisphaerae bacterium]